MSDIPLVRDASSTPQASQDDGFAHVVESTLAGPAACMSELEEVRTLEHPNLRRVKACRLQAIIHTTMLTLLHRVLTA